MLFSIATACAALVLAQTPEVVEPVPTTPPAPAVEAAPVAEVAPAPPEVVWESVLGLNLIWLAGNSEVLTFSGKAAVKRKTPSWVFSLGAGGAYGQSLSQTAPGATTEITALNAMVTARGEIVVTSAMNIYLAGTAETDHVKSVELRAGPEGGVAITLHEEKVEDFVMSSVRTDLAVRFAREMRFQYFPTRGDLPDLNLLTPRLGLGLRYAFSKEIIFTEEAEFLPNVIETAKLYINSDAKLAIKLTDVFSFATGFVVKYDSLPAPGKSEVDTSVTLGLEAAF